MNVLLHKTKEVLIAVLPVVVFVVILHFTILRGEIPNMLFIQFLIGAIAVKIGLIVLLFGIELAILPLGDHMGTIFVKSNKLWFIIGTVFILGFFVNFAEPDVTVLAEQFSNVTNIPVNTIRALVAMGAGMMLALGAVRIVKNLSLRLVLIIAYTAAFILAVIFPDFMAIAFDASGAATGAITVPLVLSLALGMASMKKDSISAEENSFGMVGIMACGAIFGLLLLNIFIKPGDMAAVTQAGDLYDRTNLIAPFIFYIKKEPIVTLQSLLPIFLIFIFFQFFKLKLHRNPFRKMIMGFVYTYIGLVIFFVGVHAGFMEMGRVIGQQLADFGHPALPIGLGAALGMLIILTEPAVYVLTHQIEDVTNGYLKRKTVLAFLAIGMAFAVGLHVLKIIVPPDIVIIKLWHYILPGYCFALIMMFFTPKMFTGISFDSGAVSSGPMTVTFILAYSQGVAQAIPHADVLRDSFGVIVMVTMMPVIALQVLGLIYKMKSKKVGV